MTILSLLLGLVIALILFYLSLQAYDKYQLNSIRRKYNVESDRSRKPGSSIKGFTTSEQLFRRDEPTTPGRLLEIPTPSPNVIIEQQPRTDNKPVEQPEQKPKRSIFRRKPKVIEEKKEEVKEEIKEDNTIGML